jgi:hypothetical protein
MRNVILLITLVPLGGCIYYNYSPPYPDYPYYYSPPPPPPSYDYRQPHSPAQGLGGNGPVNLNPP